MNMTLSLAPLVSLIAGILILVVPRLLNYIVAIYLIVIGLRHRSPVSTANYARVDVDRLTELARPWPARREGTL